MTNNLQRNVDLSSYNTLGCPAVAEHFCAINSAENLQALLQQQLPQPLWILGGGSNSILTSEISGTVLHNAILGIKQIKETASAVYLEVGSGEIWHDFVMYCVARNLGGLENLSLIPGQVGGAPVQNIGAYGVEVKSCIESVTAINLADGSSQQFSNQDCNFSYRDSIFKHQYYANNYFISSVVFKLQKAPQLNLDYPELAAQLSGKTNLSIKDVSNAVCAIRQRKLPDPAKIPNVGSFFKNPIISQSQASALKRLHPELPLYEYKDAFKTSAAWLIEQAGFKGRCQNGVCTAAQHALIIINPEHKSAQVVLDYASRIQSAVQRQFALALSIEPRVVC